MSSAPGANTTTPPAAKKHSTARLVAIVGFGNLFATILRTIGGFLIARLIFPDDLGLVNTVGLVQAYSAFLQAGVINGLNRELPYYVGKGDIPKVQNLAATAYAWSLIWAAVVLLVAIGCGAWQWTQGNIKMAAAWAAYLIPLFAFMPNMYFQATMRTSIEFTKLALIQIFLAIIGFAMILLVWWFGFSGLCWRLAIAGVLELGLLYYFRPVRVRPRVDKKELWHLLKIGIPIFIAGYAYVAWRSLDSLLIVNMYGPRMLGLFQVAVFTIGAGAALSSSLLQVTYPKMTIEYGRSHNAWNALRLTFRPLKWVAAAAIPMFLAGWFAMPYVVKWVMPKYVEGTAAAQWALVTVVGLCFMAPFSIFNVLKRQGVYLAVILAGAAVFLGAIPWRLWAQSDPLVAYAQAMAMGTIVFVIVGNLASIYVAKKHDAASAPAAPDLENSGNGLQSK